MKITSPTLNRPAGLAALLSLPLLLPLLGTAAAEVRLLFPLDRTAYQSNEWIHITALRSAPEDLPAGGLSLRLPGAGVGEMTFVFPVEKVEAAGGAARAAEHLRVNGWLLRLLGGNAVHLRGRGGEVRGPISPGPHGAGLVRRPLHRRRCRWPGDGAAPPVIDPASPGC